MTLPLGQASVAEGIGWGLDLGWPGRLGEGHRMAFLGFPVGETRDGKRRLHGPPRDSGEVLGFGAFSTRQRGVGVWESDFKKRGYIITIIVLLDAEPHL